MAGQIISSGEKGTLSKAVSGGAVAEIEIPSADPGKLVFSEDLSESQNCRAVRHYRIRAVRVVLGIRKGDAKELPESLIAVGYVIRGLQYMKCRQAPGFVQVLGNARRGAPGCETECQGRQAEKRCPVAA